MRRSRLALGTVQFGLDYGINNPRGRIPEPEAEEILRHAFQNGVDTLDTARAYGASEAVLGRILRKTGLAFDIVSKAPADWDGRADVLGESLGDFEPLYGYLLHNFETYNKNPETFGGLEKYKRYGRVKKIGFSLYRPEEAERILADDLAVDLVQIPYNLFDRRFEAAARRLKASGAEIHVRSVFLQGLFHKNPDTLAGNLLKAREKLAGLQEIARLNSLSVSELCIGFVLGTDWADKVVIGVDSLGNLKENIASEAAAARVDALRKELEVLKVSDEDILLPYKWSVQK